MKFSTANIPCTDVNADLLAVGVFEGKSNESNAFNALNKALDGQLLALAEAEDFRGKDEQTLLVHTLGKISAARIFIVGLGHRDQFDVPATRQYGAKVAEAANSRRCKSVAIVLPPVTGNANERAAQFLAEGLLLKSYRFERYRNEEAKKPPTITTVQVIPAEIAEKGDSALIPALAYSRAEIVSDAICMARDWVNEPPITLTPKALAEHAKTLSQKHGLECKILTPKECEKLGMRLFLAVGQGSTEEPRFIHLTYKPKGKEKPKRTYALVGKGVTYDSGGLSLKPSTSMEGMKGDMAGAAAVLATIGAAAQLGLPCEIHAIVAACENMVAGNSYKVDDIIVAMNGKSVEITNTDAEGRLTLADALAYAVKLQPDEVINLATLTGACMVALGPHVAGVMGSDLSLIERFLAAARRVDEEMWHLPLPTRLKDQLKSPVADLKNSGERWGGALTAGLFLKEFVGSTPWMHLDIAGPAFADKAFGYIPKGGTGFGVASLLEYLSNR